MGQCYCSTSIKKLGESSRSYRRLTGLVTDVIIGVGLNLAILAPDELQTKAGSLFEGPCPSHQWPHQWDLERILQNGYRWTGLPLQRALLVLGRTVTFEQNQPPIKASPKISLIPATLGPIRKSKKKSGSIANPPWRNGEMKYRKKATWGVVLIVSSTHYALFGKLP